MKKYSQHHLEENPDLVAYISNTEESVKKELFRLADDKRILFLPSDASQVIVIGFYIDRCLAMYQQMKKNPALPFPSTHNLARNTPSEVLRREQADDFFPKILNGDKGAEEVLYSLQLPRALPPLLYPSPLPAEDLIGIALTKLQLKMQKDEFHDYFLKKLKMANPGKELSIKNFFSCITQKSNAALESIRNASDTFYQWNQLCFFIRQDFEKVTELTADDTALLQSVFIIECCISYYRSKAQQELQRSTALKNLELNLNKPPYYFSREAINMFSDSRGVPLLGQYSEKDLTEFLHKATTEASSSKLPDLLTFKGVNDSRCYILKSKVFPLIVRLCSDAREVIRDKITKEFFASLKKFTPTPEIKNQELFERKLESAVQEEAPTLYALLNASFLRALQYEFQSVPELATGHIHLFTDVGIAPYSEILMISKEELLTDAKILLPVWYTMPFVSWLMSLFMGGQKRREKKPGRETSRKRIVTEEDAADMEDTLPPTTKGDPVTKKKDELRTAAATAEKHYVPAGSTLERELASYEQVWNKLLNKQARDNLTDDVNSLIRDYTRKILKTIRANNFTPDRLANLAETLAKAPGMQKIKDQAELCMYIQLYMVKLIKGLH